MTFTKCQKMGGNIMKCKKCGQEVDKKAVVCTGCGCKIKKPIYKKWWFWVLVAIVLAIVGNSGSDSETTSVKDVGSETNNVENTQTYIEEVVISEDEYKAQCVNIPYVDIARNPNTYVDQKATFRGKVIQVQENGKRVVLRMDVTQGDYGIWDDTVYVDYTRKDDTESRILEDDIVTVYGEIKGIKTYETVLGSQVSIPHINAEYIDIN